MFWAQLVFNIIVGLIAVAGLILATLEYTSDDAGTDCTKSGHTLQQMASNQLC